MAEHPLDLGWLRIFAEVGKSGNLTVAAERLKLTQPGVSYQIRRIEEQLGVPLLIRHHRGIDLTPEGKRLHALALRQVEEIDTLAREIRGARSRPTVRLHTDYAFASLWMMPRMQSFRDRHPEINLQIVATQNPAAQVKEADDVSVTFGSRAEAGPGAILLISEQVTPVCAPAFAARLTEKSGKSDLAGTRLIHLDNAAASWFDWNHYFLQLGHQRAGNRDEGDLSFNTYSLVIQAAIGEQGVALGWAGLVDPLLESGVLVTAGPTISAEDRGYWLVASPRKQASAEKLVTWLLEHQSH
ncbi:MAG: hypothetical protein RLZZ444_3096 [Pseudomonadota bacterium]